LVLHDSPHEFQEWLEQSLPDHALNWATNPSEVLSQLRDTEPEVVFSIKHSAFPGEAHLPALQYHTVRWFHVGGSGTDHLGQWDASRVTVTNCRGCLAPFHAERAMAALLSMSTGMRTLMEQQSRRSWQPTRFRSLQGKTLLIVGFGHTGQELARRAKAFGMRVIGVRRILDVSDPVSDLCETVYPTSALTELWSQAEVLSLNVPLGPDTHHLVDKDVLESLPSDGFVLNAARGGVIDDKALLASLEQGRHGGVWLDVTEPEPLPIGSPLWVHPKVFITPHCADQVRDFPLRFAQLFRENLQRFVNGEELLNVVRSGR
jgi:phosphoglycerate dehydrogenase-like enzyme